MSPKAENNAAPAKSPDCGVSEDPATPGYFCTCTNDFTTHITDNRAGNCPSTIPPTWTVTPTSSSTSSTSEIPFSYYQLSDGALIHCASSTLSEFQALSKETATYCAGSTSTDSVSTGVTSTTTVWPAITSPVTYGNPGYFTSMYMRSPSTDGYNATAFAESLAFSFYTAFSSACATTISSTVTSTAALSLNTFATLPGGAMGSMTRVTETATYYACAAETFSVSPWDTGSQEYTGGIDNTGKLEIAITSSLYTVDNLQTWLWAMAYRFAHATANSLTWEKILREEGRENLEFYYPFFRVPGQLTLEFGNNWDKGVALERMQVAASYKESYETELACEITQEIEEGLEMFVAMAAGPEMAALREALDITISTEARNAIHYGLESSRLMLGCGESEG
ncbi:hypothetical protein N7509_004764 [Penicillium cosmopolitanum]|uniref:Uncharacterized protein n=1 Tax=Penicillium cosmopolitanum TaxID=1131564 RepID=A0A9W9W154_9EURO|nr:uncharacterized protein N7509_004764 [Penicillium cosmopolitanum]KAJ5396651.1 hypothetical protein N7509_004764 [Penicillium cosmopolitanum]